MKEQTIQSKTVKKVLQLSEDEASEVLIFIAGLEAGTKLNLNNNQNEEPKEPTA